MADEADIAEEFQAQFLQDSLDRQRNNKSSAPSATGNCLNCDEPLAPKTRWCDTDCRDDWQREEDSRRRRLGIAPVSMPLNNQED
jgi:hypothetical protein